MALVSLAGGRLRGQTVPAARFRPLVRPVAVPLSELSTLGRARSFMADAVSLPTAPVPDQPIRVSGMVARIRAGSDGAEAFQAVCVRCPHEYCDVDFVADPKRVPPEVVAEIGGTLDKPVYMCPCHNSTFGIDAGERLAGPAPRGLYLFRITEVTETTVVIGEVEEDVLIFV